MSVREKKQKEARKRYGVETRTAGVGCVEGFPASGCIPNHPISCQSSLTTKRAHTSFSILKRLGFTLKRFIVDVILGPDRPIHRCMYAHSACCQIPASWRSTCARIAGQLSLDDVNMNDDVISLTIRTTRRQRLETCRCFATTILWQ